MRSKGTHPMNKSTKQLSPSSECSECISQLREDFPSLSSSPSSTESTALPEERKLEEERKRLKRANSLLDLFKFGREA